MEIADFIQNFADKYCLSAKDAELAIHEISLYKSTLSISKDNNQFDAFLNSISLKKGFLGYEFDDDGLVPKVRPDILEESNEYAKLFSEPYNGLYSFNDGNSLIMSDSFME